MLNKHRILILAWLLFAGFFPDFAVASSTVSRPGSPFIIDIWDNEDGLPQNSVIAMLQGRDGYLWLGTLNGLVRFDGAHFTVFSEGNTPALKSSRIVKLFEDSRANLWVGTETAGAVLVKAGRAVALDIGRGSRAGRLASATEDAAGAVWLYTADGQLARYWNGKVDVWNAGQSRFSNCRALITEKSGPMWVGMDWGVVAMGASATNSTALPVEQVVSVAKLDFLLASRAGGYWRLADGRVQKWKLNQLEHDFGAYPWASAPVAAACEDGQGNLVVGTLGSGAYWLDADGKFTRLSTEQGLSHDYILSLAVDREGSLWVGTDGGGLDRVKRRVFDVLEDTRGLPVQSVCEDAPGGLWLGFNGDGVGFWSDGKLQKFGPAQGLVDRYVRSVFVDREQHVWAGTYGGGLFQLQDGRFQRANDFPINNAAISAIFQDRAGRLWCGTQNGLACRAAAGWKIFTRSNGLASDDVRAVAEDADGNLWFGTADGLSRWRDGQFVSFHKKDGLPGENVSALFAAGDGNLWVGTDGAGLARLRGGKWTAFTAADGLVSDSIGYLAADSAGSLWIGSYAGLMRVPEKSLDAFADGLTNTISVRVFNRADGLPTSECTQGSQPIACRTHDGKLWLPTIKGVVAVNPAQLAPNTNPPPAVIESVRVDGRETSTGGLRAAPPGAVVLPPGSGRLEIQFTSLNLAARERARFKYRLEGHETAWTEVGGDARVARYPKLPPGRYRFQVAACNEDGVWSAADAVLAVEVQPPFWQTRSFLVTATLAFLGALAGMIYLISTAKLKRQLRLAQQKELIEKERARIARDLHDQLGANLTQVTLLGELAEADKALPGEVEQHAQQICATARETTRSLDEIVWAVNPSNDTLESLANYVCKYAQDYFALAGVSYRAELPASLPATPILPEVRHNVFLAFKEAVNNVVKHAHATEARVKLELQPGKFILSVADNGRGLSDISGKKTRNGLNNMRRRLADVRGGCEIAPGPAGGTVVKLAVPIATS